MLLFKLSPLFVTYYTPNRLHVNPFFKIYFHSCGNPLSPKLGWVSETYTPHVWENLGVCKFAYPLLRWISRLCAYGNWIAIRYWAHPRLKRWCQLKWRHLNDYPLNGRSLCAHMGTNPKVGNNDLWTIISRVRAYGNPNVRFSDFWMLKLSSPTCARRGTQSKIGFSDFFIAIISRVRA